jgi:hypothetical protein
MALQNRGQKRDEARLRGRVRLLFPSEYRSDSSHYNDDSVRRYG